MGERLWAFLKNGNNTFDRKHISQHSRAGFIMDTKKYTEESYNWLIIIFYYYTFTHRATTGENSWANVTNVAKRTAMVQTTNAKVATVPILDTNLIIGLLMLPVPVTMIPIVAVAMIAAVAAMVADAVVVTKVIHYWSYYNQNQYSRAGFLLCKNFWADKNSFLRSLIEWDATLWILFTFIFEISFGDSTKYSFINIGFVHRSTISNIECHKKLTSHMSIQDIYIILLNTTSSFILRFRSC